MLWIDQSLKKRQIHVILELNDSLRPKIIVQLVFKQQD
jgi:hypothetical protein